MGHVLDDDFPANDNTAWNVPSLLIVFLAVAIEDGLMEKDWTNTDGADDCNITIAIIIVNAPILLLNSEVRCMIQGSWSV